MQASDPLLAVRDPLLRGDFRAAAEWLSAHTATHPDDARAFGLLGKCQRELKRLSAAETSLLRSLTIDPNLFASRRELALLKGDFGDTQGAIAALRELLPLTPNDVSLWWELARHEAGMQPTRALEALTHVRRLRPDDIDPALVQGQLLFRTDQFEGARANAEWILRRQGNHVEALDLLYQTAVRLRAPGAVRLDLAQRLAMLGPTAPRLLAYAHELYQAGEFNEGKRQALAAATLDPEFLPAQWAAFQQPAAAAPDSDEAAQAFMREWSAGLNAFEQMDFSEPLKQLDVWGCVGQATAFYRHYLPDDLDEQRRYGARVASMMAAIDPGMAPRPLRARRRVGIVGAHFRFHTVARLFGPLIEALGAYPLDLEVFALEDCEDGWAARLAKVATLHSGQREARDWRKLIGGRELDVLIYPEIGMHPLTAGLAAIRLAPVQVALWGHPVSTGLPTIDYLLSPAAMEPDDAERCYSEQLIRLPGLGHGLEASAYPEPGAVELLPPDPQRIDLVCAQTVYKLLPAQDRVFARILAALPEACLHLLVDDRAPVRDWLRRRMTPTLLAAGADPERQLRMHGFLDFQRFLGLAKACRLNLDSVGWSGGMSAIDLLSQGLPTISTEGPTMRCRQTAALLRRLDASELIARDEDHYVELAVALARDEARLAELRTRLFANRERLFGSQETVVALAEFLQQVMPRTG